jgi:UDP-2,3-diacylglucosamine pyrophosphatase LpxH
LKVIAVSDLHLGYENSDKASFNNFLEQLLKDQKITDLVLLGDIVDMWRRDSSGVFLENWDTIEKVIALQRKKIRVHYVAGNHDFHVLRLENHSYPFKFVKDLSDGNYLIDGNYRYRFLHGYEFDPAQQEPMMEALCRVMSDETGEFESGLWATLTRDWSDFRYWTSSLLRKESIRRAGEKLQLEPGERLKDILGQIEREACSRAQPNEILVFGHTHSPFVNKAENVVNSGSWVTEAPVHNTYVQIEAGKPRLLAFEGAEITKRIGC